MQLAASEELIKINPSDLLLLMTAAPLKSSCDYITQWTAFGEAKFELANMASSCAGVR